MRISDWSSDVCSSDLNAVYGKAGFRNAGGENNLAHASFSGANGSALVRRVERTVQLVNDDSRWQSIQPLGSTFYLGHAWQKSEQIAALLLQRRSEEHTSELQSLMRISYAVFCLKKK